MKTLLKFDLHRKRFRVVVNEHGMSNELTIFSYRVEDDLVLGSYRGGPIRTGQIIGMTCDDDAIDMRFQCVTSGGELKAGRSRAVLSTGHDGRIVMLFDWSWLTQDGGEAGTSTHVEVQ